MAKAFSLTFHLCNIGGGGGGGYLNMTFIKTKPVGVDDLRNRINPQWVLIIRCATNSHGVLLSQIEAMQTGK